MLLPIRLTFAPKLGCRAIGHAPDLSKLLGLQNRKPAKITPRKPPPKPAARRMDTPLSRADGPLVWVDCEMTGLNFKTDCLLEIAVIITDGQLKTVHDGIEYVIRRDKSILDNMGEWCTNQHGASGLTQACIESPHDLDHVKQEVLQYIQKWIPEKGHAVLAGNSVHADRMFLANEMPEVLDWLHYRIVDVSSIKEVTRRWYPHMMIPKDYVESHHRALDDIRGSIRELGWYRKRVFRPTSPGSSPGSRGSSDSQPEQSSSNAHTQPQQTRKDNPSMPFKSSSSMPFV